jgi:RNA polymerase sigma-70 factor (ECF subfamily)
MTANSESRLSQISTRWTVFFEAHGESQSDPAKEARRELLTQYGRPVYRYLLAAVRDPHAADDLYQDFALKFVRGELKRASPDRGRFRDFLKTTLYHLIVDHHRARSRAPDALPQSELIQDLPPVFTADEEFYRQWRGRLLDCALNALDEQQTERPLAKVLRLRMEFPDETAEQLAQRLSHPPANPVDAGWVRKRLHQARQRLAALLVDAVKATLDNPNPDEIVQELIDLDLYEWCRGALPGK